MKLFLRALSILIALIAVVVGFSYFKFSRLASASVSLPAFTIADEVRTADVELGKRIYSVRNGCIDCHGPNLAGAMVMDDPAMGSIYGANITPFELKEWTDEEVAGAIRYGIHRDKRSLHFMPSFDFEKLSKSDIAAVIAYLRSVPEVQQPSHVNSFGPMARLLSAFGQMPVMFPANVVDQTHGFSDKPEEAPSLEFGKYLANACVGCHGAEFKGGKIPGGDPAWPTAANIRLGANKIWSEESFKKTIATGISATTGNALRMPMPVPLLKQMNDTELKALWIYLASMN